MFIILVEYCWSGCRPGRRGAGGEDGRLGAQGGEGQNLRYIQVQ